MRAQPRGQVGVGNGITNANTVQTEVFPEALQDDQIAERHHVTGYRRHVLFGSKSMNDSSMTTTSRSDQGFEHAQDIGPGHERARWIIGIAENGSASTMRRTPATNSPGVKRNSFSACRLKVQTFLPANAGSSAIY